MRMSAALLLAVSLLLFASYPTTTDAQCIQSPGELGPLLDVLNADIKYWRDKLGGQKLTHENLTLLIGRNDYRWNDNPWNGEAAGMVNSAYTAVLIYNNKWYFPFREWGYDANCTRGDDWCSHRMTRTQEAFYRWTAAGARFPNSVFLLDLENGGSCRVEAECPAPVFSIFDVMKEPENFPNFEFRIQHGKGAIMVPDMTHSATTKLVTRPWNEKARKAIFRGSLHCPVIFVNRVCPCSRVHFVDMVKKPKPEHGDAPQFVDADGWDEHDAHADDIRIPDWPQEYSKYMFTLALDGQSGNMKMEGLLHINSVILKEHSPVVEFFERVLKPNEHYVPILLNNSYDALDLIKTMPETDMQRIANNAQQFAQRYLCDDAKRFYFQRAIEEYNSLFADMEGYITDVVLPLMSVKERLGLGHHYQNLPKPDKFEP